MRLGRASFAILVPIVALSAWGEMILAPTISTALLLRRAALSGEEVHAGEFILRVPRGRWLPSALERTTILGWRQILAMNIPGSIVEIMISLPTSWPASWAPAGIPLFEWRAFTLPFFCLPAWWFVGRGLDGLAGRRRMSLVAVIAGAALSLLCLVMALGLRFGLTPEDRQDIGWALCGLGFWAVAFASVPLSRLRPLRASKE